MSRQHTIKIIQLEIARLNREIDLKIIHGLSYRGEARRHKMLMSQLRHLTPSRFNWINGLRESLSHISFASF